MLLIDRTVGGAAGAGHGPRIMPDQGNATAFAPAHGHCRERNGRPDVGAHGPHVLSELHVYLFHEFHGGEVVGEWASTPGIEDEPGGGAVVDHSGGVFDVSGGVERQGLGGVAGLEVEEALGGEGVEPVESVGAVDFDDVEVAEVGVGFAAP